MKKIIKKKWVAALRSGKFRQANEVLFDGVARAHCCLGVLARVQGAKSSGGLLRIGDKDVRHNSRAFGEQDYLAKPFACGVTLPVQKKLALMNDAPKSFDEIADYIEKHL